MNAPRWRRDAAAFGGLAFLLALAYRPVFSGRVLAGVDAFQLAIPDASFLLDCIRAGEWPLWSPYERLGQPFAGQLQSQAFYLPRVLSVLLSGPYWGITIEQLFHAAVSGVGTFLACRSLGRSRGASFMAAAAFAFGPMCTELANVPNMAGSAAWSGLMLFASMRRRSMLLAFIIAASLMAGSPETLLWQFAVVLVVSGELWRPGLAAGSAFIFAAVAVLPTLEFLSQSVRLERVPGQFAWSAPASSLMALFWLNADLPRPPGEQHLVACLFQGSVMGLLAVLAVTVRGRTRRLLILGIALAVLALGERFLPSRLMLSVPPLSLFRYPVKYLVGASFCLTLVSARGLDRLRALSRLRRFPPIPILVAGVIAFVMLALTARWLPVRGNALVGLGWGAAFIVLALIAFILPRGLERPRVVAFGASAIALAELACVSFLWGTPMWLPARDLERPSRLASVLPTPTEGRVSVVLTNEERMALWPQPEALALQSRDYLLPLRNVEDHIAIVEGYGPPEPRNYFKAAELAPEGLRDLAGVTHVLRGGQEPVRTTAMPRAFLAYRTKLASDDEMMRGLQEGLHSETLLSQGTALGPQGACISLPPVWIEYRATSLTIQATPCQPAYLVVTDSFFPGWEATVDGAPATIERADLLVRAILLPPGKHVVRMVYRPASFRWGAALSALGLVTAALLLVRPRSKRIGVAAGRDAVRA